MDIEKFAGSKFFMFFEMFYKLVIINILWFFTVLLGVGFLTWLPATFSAYFVIHSMSLENSQIRYLKGYFVALKKNYIKFEIIFLIALFTSLIFRFNIMLYTEAIKQVDNFIYTIGFGVTLLMIVLLVFTLVHTFFIGLYFPEYKVFKTIKYSLMFSLIMPFRTLSVIFLGLIMFGSVYVFPQIIPLLFLVFVSVHILISIKIIKPKYETLLKDKEPITIDNYID